MRFTERLKAPKGLALAVFITLVVVAVAQISWWILFQITISREQEKVYTQVADKSAALVASLLNQQLERITAQTALIANANDSPRLIASLDQLLSDPIVIGYRLTDSEGDVIAESGRQDTSFFYRSSGSVTIHLFLNQDYPIEFISGINSDLAFRGDNRRGAYSHPWYTSEMFSIKPEVLAEVKDKAFHRIVMFLAEGSFFVLLTLFGAFMIYRALHQTEEHKLQQENFIHAVTHEFKIPVASIKLYLETMASQKIDKEKCLSLVPRMLDDCHRLERLVDNVLEAGRLTRKSHHLNLAPANLSADLNEYLGELRTLIERSHMKLSTSIEPDLTVRTDYQAMFRVVSALVDNAIKYSPASRRELTISAKAVDDKCVLSFTDLGVGVAPQDQHRIFERFYRTGMESTRSVKGTGLGLFLVKEIVMEHGGSVSVHSEGADRGSTFVIKLPLEKQR